MSDPCFKGLSQGVEVCQLHFGGRKRKLPDFVDACEVGRAWTVVRPDLLKKWNGEAK